VVILAIQMMRTCPYCDDPFIRPLYRGETQADAVRRHVWLVHRTN